MINNSTERWGKGYEKRAHGTENTHLRHMNKCFSSLVVTLNEH